MISSMNLLFSKAPVIGCHRRAGRRYFHYVRFFSFKWILEIESSVLNQGQEVAGCGIWLMGEGEWG